MVLMLRQCCCCCSLKTGTIILGVLSILGALWNVVDGVRAAAAARDFVDDDSKNVFVAVIAVGVVLGVILLLVSIFLIIGAQKGKPALLVPWMVYTIVSLFAITILYIFLAARIFAMGDTYSGAVYSIVAVIFILLETYFLLVVYSLYRELKGTAPPNIA